ncbi:UDP-4-amino-4,6-dideoxy-N-acetyl-beta-L-altrosami ne transaminase [Castellaniella ginsengisoli]|uniref:UDP-4-amino-4, 6-dideoxy-N-acetyl-beta-L-altrosami ne transaminase n=1 Tax=Castellaniella ginsengisoli TaxID=546114 RepID=A0ABN1KNU9_9BURK
MIPYGRQDISQADIDAVVDVLRSDFLTQGPRVPAFEQAIAAKVKAKYAVASNSATSALHLACLALGLGPGDLLWTSPITFVATANCALYCGAQVDFVDIDPLTYNMDVGALESKLIEADRIGRLPKIVVPVHLSGQSCDMEAIHVLADRYGFKIIEDASHAIGGKYQGQYVGFCQHSDITVFSFHPVKIITTAEGGMATTNSEALAEQMKLLRSHGITRDPSLMTHKPDGPWYYQQIALGLNYRMTELQAALGISQLERLDEYVTKRHEVARRYDLAFEGLPITIPVQHSRCYSAYHLYVIRLHLEDIRMAHGDVFEKLRSQGVGVNLHYIPVHTQPYYRSMGFRIGQFPEAEKYYREAISLPMYATLSHDEQLIVQSAVKSIIQ